MSATASGRMRPTLTRLDVLLILLVVCFLSSPAVAQQDTAVTRLPSVSMPRELERVLRDYEQAWSTGDAAGLASLFTEDGFVMSNGRLPVRGRDGIETRYRGAGGDLRLRAHAFATDDTVGYIIGSYGYGAEIDVPDVGKFVLVLRRRPGEPWLIAADIDNSNRR